MSGWAMVAVIVALFIIATIGLNARLWRRHKAISEARPEWSEKAFLAALDEMGIDRAVSAAVIDEILPYYSAGLLPHPDDDFVQVLRIDSEEIDNIVENVVERLGQSLPDAKRPEVLPAFATVGDMAKWLQERTRRFAAVEKIKSLRGTFPADYRFDRDEANARGSD